MGVSCMNEFEVIKKFIIKELFNKSGIKEKEIGLLDSGCIDLDEDLFWHSYQHNVGKITKRTRETDKEEIFDSWGDNKAVFV